MSVTDIQRAFVRGLDGKAACKVAAYDMVDGGRVQRLSFHVVSGSHGSAYLCEEIPADMDPMQHARVMAANYLEGRISDQSRMLAPGAGPVPWVPMPAALPQVPAAAPVAVPVAPVAALAPIPLSVPPTAPAATPEPATGHQVDDGQAAPGGERDLAADIAELDRLAGAGDIPGCVELICRWIDADAELVRVAALGGNPGQALEYEQIRREINDVAHGLCPATPQECPHLWASVGVEVSRTGDDAADILAAASVVNSRIDATNEFLARVRQVRMASKHAARMAGTLDGALAVYKGIDWPA